VTLSTNRKTQSQWTQDLIDMVSPGADWPGVGHQWWYNSINSNSLRLTKVGYAWIERHTDLKLHEVKLQEKILPKQLLQLERLLGQPYFIKTLSNLMVMSEQDAVMLQLHGGDLPTYLNNLEANQ